MCMHAKDLHTNVFLLYKFMISNRKARENDRLGNEEVYLQYIF